MAHRRRRTSRSANRLRCTIRAAREGRGQSQSPPTELSGTARILRENASAATRRASAATAKAAADARAMLNAAPRDSQLRGEPVRLVDVISTARSHGIEQTQRVEAYWDLCSSVADYYLGLREQEELQAFGSFGSQPGAEPGKKRKRSWVCGSARRSERRTASQFRLASLIGRGANNLPLPADLPHCGSYTTHYRADFRRPEFAGGAGACQLAAAALCRAEGCGDRCHAPKTGWTACRIA